MEFDIWVYLEHLSRKWTFSYNLTTITGTKTSIYFRSYLARLFSEWEQLYWKSVEQIKTAVLRSVAVFRKSCLLWHNVEKCCVVVRGTHENTTHAHYMLDTNGYKHTLRTFYIPILSVGLQNGIWLIFRRVLMTPITPVSPSVRPSECISAAANWQISVKFNIVGFYKKKSFEKIRIWLKWRKNIENFTWRPK